MGHALTSTSRRHGAFRWKHRLFVRASHTLTRSLDYDTVLDGVARVAIPHLGDWTSVYVPSDGVLGSRLVVAHRSPRKEALLADIWQLWHRQLPETHPHVKSLRSGAAVTMSDEAVSAVEITPDAQHAATLQRIGVGCVLVVPLVAHGAALGSMMLVRSGAAADALNDERFQQIAADLAQCAAQVIYNSRLFREAKLAIRLRDENIANTTQTLIELLTRMQEHADGIREQSQADGVWNGQSHLKRGLAQIQLLVREMEHIIRELQLDPAAGQPA
jgi:GAF domain